MKTDITNKIFNEDALLGINKIADSSVDLIVADPPYCLGKDYGNDSDKLSSSDYLEWMFRWFDLVYGKLKENGSLYIFLSWQYTPEIFSYFKKKMRMVNEIIWDRHVPSMGGSTRKYSSVYDSIGFFVKNDDYYFDLDSIRVPYDEATKKARTRSIFVGKKWLEMGYNPKDLWSYSRIHKQDPERRNHPTQKPLFIIERIIKASCPIGGLVLDPFMGSGTTAVASVRNNRNFVGFEINENYYKDSLERIKMEKQKGKQLGLLLEASGASFDKEKTIIKA
ncbi:MAG TPA: site-specific DNA-methyltransferase [Candidatus Pacearchaeota archaeon]|nr:site-specific DNA-methyltransferase [Candidatus Pacearchaeota archaeon]